MARKAKLERFASQTGPVPEVGTPAGMDQWLTRGEVAAILRVSIATVRRLQGRELHPQRSPEGIYLFDPREVEEVRLRRPPPPATIDCREPGEVAAEAFRLLRDGTDVRDVVIALRRPPDEIEALYAQWERLGGMLFVSPRVRVALARMAEYELIDPDIVDAIEDDDADTIRDFITAAVGD